MRRAERGRSAAAALLLAAAALPLAVGAEQEQAGGAATFSQLSGLRAVFMRRVDEEGYRLCAAPAIERGDAARMVRYLPQRNAIVIGAAAARGAQGLPQSADYAWSFVHELGHWWQYCRQLARPQSYGAENGAERIALAFWREREPRIAQAMVQGAQITLQLLPEPLAAGESPQVWLDAHPEALAQDGSARWLQAQMIATLSREQPAPSFHKALSQPLFPW